MRSGGDLSLFGVRIPGVVPRARSSPPNNAEHLHEATVRGVYIIAGDVVSANDRSRVLASIEQRRKPAR